MRGFGEIARSDLRRFAGRSMTNTEKVQAQINAGITDRAEISRKTQLSRKQVSSSLENIRRRSLTKAEPGIRFQQMKGLTAHQRQAMPAYKPRAKQEGEAGSNGINLMSQPTFDPSKHLGARMGIAR